MIDHIWYYSMRIYFGIREIEFEIRLTHNSKHTYIHRHADEMHQLIEKPFVCARVYIMELKIKVNTYYQYLLYIFTIMDLSSGVLHIIHHSSVQGESTPNLL